MYEECQMNVEQKKALWSRILKNLNDWSKDDENK